MLFHDYRAVGCTQGGYEWGIHRAQWWIDVTVTTRMPHCLPKRVFLFEPGPVSRSGSGPALQCLLRTSECSRITIPIGQATLSRYKRTVTVHCIFFEPDILSRLNRLQSFKARAIWLPPLKTGASGSLKWGCFGKLIASVQPSILLPIHLEGHFIHFECDLPLFFNKLLTRGQLCVKNSLLCSTNTEQLPPQAINKAKFQFK